MSKEEQKLVAHLLNIFRHAVKQKKLDSFTLPKEKLDDASNLCNKNIVVLQKTEVKQVIKIEEPESDKPVAFGIMTRSGLLAGASVTGSFSDRNSAAQTLINQGIENLNQLKLILPKADFSIAIAALTTDACPQTGQPIDFDWGLYPEQRHPLSTQGIQKLILVAPATGQSRYMQLCA